MTGVVSYRSQWDPASQRSTAILLPRSLSVSADAPLLITRAAAASFQFLLIIPAFTLKLEVVSPHLIILVLSRSGPGIREGRRILAGDQQEGKTGWNHQLPGKISQPRCPGQRRVPQKMLCSFIFYLNVIHYYLREFSYCFLPLLRISSVQLPYGQRSGQLLLPEEGIPRESSV